MKKQSILVVVHPGSCCGSATHNLGRLEARASRDAIAAQLERWTGGVVILDGELSDELPYYPHLEMVLAGALARAADAGLVAERRLADDPDQDEVMLEIVGQRKLTPASASFELTGAWWEPATEGGCVGSVLTALKGRGFKATVSPEALELDESDDAFEADEEDDDHAHVLAGQMDLPTHAHALDG